MRSMGRASVGSSCMNVLSELSPDPADQQAQDDHAAAEKDDDWPGPPDQSVDEIVQLPTRHAPICCEFHATPKGVHPHGRDAALPRPRSDFWCGDDANQGASIDIAHITKRRFQIFAP